ncbi:MAG: GntR family transcriptional regulator [Pseudomonadota bacterium]
MQPSKGLTGEAYDKFKRGLLSRQITPGVTSSQSELADLLAVSVSPLRNALKILETEGFVTILPRSGIRISKPDLELVRNTYQLRRIIEEPALVKFAEHCSRDELLRERDVHLAILERANGQVADPMALFDEASEIDIGLHKKMVGSLSNPIIDTIYHTNHERIMLIRLDRHMATASYVRVTFTEHLRIIDALISGDVEGARIALGDHLDKAIQRAMGI